VRSSGKASIDRIQVLYQPSMKPTIG